MTKKATMRIGKKAT